MARSTTATYFAVPESDSPTARAEAALTHPATLLALATLLVNDLLFKSLWPGSWWTGKLSDLAWVIFASPLLALPLTFLARRNPIAQKTAWVIAYVGLPLFYAAYNTFEPLHDAVMAVFAQLSGIPDGSPMDPSDSIVVPLGMGIGIWVWSIVKVDSGAVKIRLGLLVACVACLASIASSVITTEGIIAVGTTNDGTIVVHDNSAGVGAYFLSNDGGFSWTRTGNDAVSGVEWGTNSTMTSRGEYVIRGRAVVRNTEFGQTNVYSPPIDDQMRHRRAIRAATIQFGNLRSTSTVPSAIIYDDHSDNVVVAVRTQGVLVQTPDARWHQVAVSSYKPIDFTPIAVIQRVNNYTFWILALAASLSTIALSLSIALVGLAVGGNKGVFLWVSVAVASSFGAIFSFSDQYEPFTVVGELQGFAVPAATVGALISCLVIGTLWPRRTYLLVVALTFSLMFALCYLCFYLWMGGYIELVISKFFLVVLMSVAGFILGSWVRNDWRHRSQLEI